MNAPVLDVRGLVKRYGAHAALNDVSFAVDEGQIVALLGDNGAGKSTTVKMLCGVDRPDQGTIAIDGEEVSLDSPSTARHHGVGAVFQDLALFDNLSVAENLWAGMELKRPAGWGGLGWLRKQEMQREARAILDRLEVRIPNTRTPVGLLSGGQRQAIAVSKGVAFARRLVILDEPTAALGLRERRNVLDLLRRLPETGVSVVLISHNLEEVISVADKAVVLRQGNKVGELPATADNHEQIVSLIVGGK